MYTNLHKIKKKLKGPQEVVFGLQRDSEALRTPPSSPHSCCLRGGSSETQRDHRSLNLILHTGYISKGAPQTLVALKT